MFPHVMYTRDLERVTAARKMPPPGVTEALRFPFRLRSQFSKETPRRELAMSDHQIRELPQKEMSKA